MPVITIYGKQDCPACIEAKAFFAGKSVPIREIDIDQAPKSVFDLFLKDEVKAGYGIEAGESIITFFGNIVAKFASCLRIAVGFNSTEEKTITAKIRKGKVVLGKVVKTNECDKDGKKLK